VVNTNTSAAKMWKSAAPSCKSCCHPIIGEYIITSVGDKLHKNCFRCKVCYDSLVHNGLYLKNGGYYCRKCYDKNFGMKCQTCKTYIIKADYVAVAGSNYHSNCFRCNKCSGVITYKYYTVEGLYYCKSCRENVVEGDDGQILPGIELLAPAPDCISNNANAGDQAQEQNNRQAKTTTTAVSSAGIEKPTSKFDESSNSESVSGSAAVKGKSKAGRKKKNWIGIIGTFFVKTFEMLL